MTSHDTGTRILHDLGILDSKVQSPRRQLSTSNDNPEAGHSQPLEDDSTQKLITDSTPVLPTVTSQRRASSNITRFKELSLYAALFVLIGTAWIVVINLPSISWQSHFSRIYDARWIPTCLGFGCLIGSYILIPFIIKFNASLVIQLATFISIAIITIASRYQGLSCWMIASTSLGVFMGVGERFSYLYVYQVLSGSKRKLFVIYAVFALAILYANISVPLINNTTPLENSHSRMKREDGLPAINLTISEPQPVTEGYHPTKPSSAIGNLENLDTKTAENAEKRKLAEQKKANASSSSDESSNDNKSGTLPDSINATKVVAPYTTVPVTTTTTTTATTTPTPTTTVITTPVTTNAPKTVPMTSFELPMKTETLKLSTYSYSIPSSRGRNRMSSEKSLIPTSVPSTTTVSPYPLAFKILAVVFSLFILIVVIISFTCNFFWDGETLIDLAITADSHRNPSLVTELLTASLWIFSDFLTFGLLSVAPFISAEIRETPFFYVRLFNFSVDYGISIWVAVLLMKGFCVMFSNFAITKTCSQIILGISVTLSLTSFFVSDIDISFMALLGTSITLSSLPLIITLYKQEALNLSPYTTSGRYLLWSSVGRCLGPLTCGKILAVYSFQVLVNFTLALVVAILIIFYSFIHNIASDARHHQFQDLTMDISAASNSASDASRPSNGSAAFKPRNGRNGNSYALLANENDSLSNCLVSDDSDDDIFN